MTASAFHINAFVRRTSVQYEIGCMADVSKITQARYFSARFLAGRRGAARGDLRDINLAGG
jgi:hypothetical protein